MSTPQSASSTSVEAGHTRTFYRYGPMDQFAGRKLVIYTGQQIEVSGIDPAPANATDYPPPTTMPGFVAYWTGTGWFIWRDVRQMSLQERKDLVTAALNERLRLNTQSLSAGYDAAEMYTWRDQETAALDYQRDGTESYLLKQLAVANGYTLPVLCQRILYKADQYRAAYTDVLARYQETRNQIDATTDATQLPPVGMEDLLRVNSPVAPAPL